MVIVCSLTILLRYCLLAAMIKRYDKNVQTVCLGDIGRLFVTRGLLPSQHEHLKDRLSTKAEGTAGTSAKGGTDDHGDDKQQQSWVKEGDDGTLAKARSNEKAPKAANSSSLKRRKVKRAFSRKCEAVAMM